LQRPALRRTVWVVADQGASSLTNFAATVVIARSVDASVFGAFSVAFAVYVLCAGTSRALVTQPLMIRESADIAQGTAVAAAAGAALAVGCGTGGAVLVAGLLVPGQTGAVLIALSFCLPGLLLQDAWRYAFFAAAEPRRALINDLCWAGAQLVLIGAVVVVGRPGAVALTAAWGGSATLAAAYGAVQTRLAPAVRESLRYLRHHADLGGHYSVAFLFHTGTLQLTVLLVGALVGSVGVGALRGAQTVFGPFVALTTGIMSAAISEGSRLYARQPSRLLPVLRAVSGALMCAALVWGAVALNIPDDVGESVLGDTWSNARDLLAPILVLVVGLGWASGAQTGLAVLAASRAALTLRIVAGSAVLAAGVLGATLAGAQGAAWGLALGPWLLGAGAWRILSRMVHAQLAA
jgi:O-antigen/teichoic acid export membrane protein